MPSIAQQDYLKISAKSYDDYNLYIQLLRLLERGTIFDALIQFPQGDMAGMVTKPVALAYIDNAPWVYIPTTQNTTSPISLYYTETQYEGLAAIQKAHVGDYAREVALTTYGYPNDDEPFIYLADDEANAFICVDDKLLVCTTDGDGQIVSLEVSDIKEEGELGHINISWEDAQKLIGLPIP